MAIFFSVLKWIGLILLFLLGFLLVMLCYLLFLPLHYHIAGHNGKEDQLSGEIRAYGFLHFWQMAFREENDEYQLAIYVFWGKCKLYPRKQKQTKEEKAEQEDDLSRCDGVLDEEDIKEILLDKEVEFSPHQEEAEKEEPDTLKTEKKETKAKKVKNEKKTSLKDFHNKWKDEHNRNAVNFFLKKILWLIKKTKPNVLYADVDFSLGDPALTGIATGIVSLCPACYGRKTRIIPDFESDDVYVYGWIEIKGIVFLVHIVYLIISIILNKDIRRLLRS